MKPSTPVSATQASSASATCAGAPQTIGPMPPNATWRPTSRTVQVREGSARVMLSIAVRPASFSTWRTSSSRSKAEKSTPVQPAISTSPPSGLASSRIAASFCCASASVPPSTIVIMEKIFSASRARPAASAASRKAATRGAITRADGPETNTHSACRPANAFPRDDEPAW